MTVCHLIAFLCLDVAHITKILDNPYKPQDEICRRLVLHHSKPKQADGAVVSSVVHTLWACEAADKEYSDNNRCTRWDLQFVRDEADNPDGCVVPHEVHWFGNDCYRDVEEHQPEGDYKP